MKTLQEQRNEIKMKARDIVGKMTDSMAREMLIQLLIHREVNGWEGRMYDSSLLVETENIVSMLIGEVTP